MEQAVIACLVTLLALLVTLSGLILHRLLRIEQILCGSTDETRLSFQMDRDLRTSRPHEEANPRADHLQKQLQEGMDNIMNYAGPFQTKGDE